MSRKPLTVVVAVISDLVTDQRVHRTSLSLHQKGLKVTLVGRRKKDSLILDVREYDCVRFQLPLEKGPLFYLSYNLRLLFYLLFHKADVVVANDLDTLPASFLASKLKGSKLYYDSHEYFTGVPELESRPRVQRIWKRIERRILPKLKHIFTVNESIANLYRQEYGVEVKVVRNIPLTPEAVSSVKTREQLGLPRGKHILLFQGAGINIQRGAEEALEAMQYLDDAILLFIGGGDVIGKLRKECISLNLQDKVYFMPKLPFRQLREYTMAADLGLTLDKDTNLNYRYSLPNKLFDYIHAGIPVLASELPEVSRIVRHYRIGAILPSHDPRVLANTVKDIFANPDQIRDWKNNLVPAAAELCWENEREKLYAVFKDVC